MQLDEQIELAFKAGAEWTLDNVYCEGLDECNLNIDRDIKDGFQEYINGNSQSGESSQVLDKSHGGSI